MRRAGLAIREPDGSWSIAADHLDQVSRYEAGRAREAPVRVELLSSRPIEQLVGADAVTWLDRELVADTSEPLRESGFGAAVRDAQARRDRKSTRLNSSH